ncbi:hypothetical protein D9615_006996 [Tricholomella constricta]|uniref:LysM domain-containing protein n=1 Tax=Tricholomella constricta TaxID=117010 RepID=A0A8H5M2W0_9AGAR|nr:hypothetical protein D9615_006996 [Tricholomella constricta]
MLLSLILLACGLVARADVFPNFPAADIERSGSTCRIGWGGDTSSTTAWKDMTIQLMTGDNFNMVHITTVATAQDGTVDGSFSWICPEVTPNSAIYFYQFRSPHTPNYQWTTRFTIASSSGQTTPPTNNTQPDGANIPWGTGALKDPSIAVPPPVFPTTTTTTNPTPTTTVPTSTATPTNVAPGIVAGCTGFFTETDLLCWQIVSQFGITLEDFEAWNGGSNVCNTLQAGLAYCIARPTPTNPSPVPTPTNVAPSVVTGCTAFFTETNLLCYEIAQKFGITVDNFEAWNGGSSVCNTLQTGLAYCVAAQPANAAPSVIAGCRSFFTETNLLCYQIAEQYGITVSQFQDWNGGSNVCNVLEPGLAYCVVGPSPTTPTTPAPVPTPTNVASGVVAGCTNFFTETDLLCYQIAANFGITVTQFEAWNGAGVCNVLVTGKAYCVAGP